MVMTKIDNVSGVDRYLEVLIKEFRKYNFIRVKFIRFIASGDIHFLQISQINPNMSIYTIPLPCNMENFVKEEYWMKEYFKTVVEKIEPLFDSDEKNIIHIHTLNLITLAVMLRAKYKCKIVTHMHCIPWKSLYNSDRAYFNELYRGYYYGNPIFPLVPSNFVLSKEELNSYMESDSVICVTKSCKNFLTRIVKLKNKVSVVYNGLPAGNMCSNSEKRQSNRVFTLLYVGDFSESKGFTFLLQSLRKVQQQGSCVKLIAVGKISGKVKEKIFFQYKELNIYFTGLLSKKEIIPYYKSCDIGIITSLQEQCSYVALEMMKYQRPIIVTNVDGLNELFVNGNNCLMTRVVYTLSDGLRVDVDNLAHNICVLINNPSLRYTLGKNANKRFKQNYDSCLMVQKTLNIYYSLFER